MLYTLNSVTGSGSGRVKYQENSLQNQASGHIEVKKGTDHVFYMATPSLTNENVITLFHKRNATLISRFFMVTLDQGQ